MAVYSDAVFAEKLSKLVDTQESIETVSTWILLFHRKSHAEIVNTWRDQFYKVPLGRKLAFIYLANDIMQKSRKGGPEFLQSFSTCIAGVIKHAAETHAAPVERLRRMLDIWQDRRVFPSQFVNDIRASIGLPPVEGPAEPPSISTEPQPRWTQSSEPPKAISSHSYAPMPGLPLLSSETSTPKNAAGASASLFVAKVLKNVLPILSSLENSSLGLDLLRDRSEMVRPTLASGEEIETKLAAEDDDGALALIDELDDDAAHVTKFHEALQEEINRRCTLIEEFKAVIEEQEALVAQLKDEHELAQQVAIQAETTLNQFISVVKKRKRTEESDSTQEPPQKASKLDEIATPSSSVINCIDTSFLSQLQSSLTSLQSDAVASALPEDAQPPQPQELPQTE